jgi:hypothetical protein
MDEYIDEIDETTDEKQPFGIGYVLKKTIKFIFWGIIIVGNVLLLWRVFSSGDTKIAKSFVWTNDTIALYNQDSESFEAYKHEYDYNFTADGTFSVSNLYLVPSADQVQFTVRYNNSTLKKLMKEYNLADKPVGETFVYRLTDNLGNEYTEYEFITDSKNVYNYRRVVFDGIKMTDSNTGENVLETLTLNIYYAKDVLLSEPYDTLEIYNASRRSTLLDMKDHLFKNNEPTKNLMPRISYNVIEEEPEE